MSSPFKKTLLLHKINWNTEKHYKKEIDGQFDTVDNFFDTSGKIVVGKKINFCPLNAVKHNGTRASGYRMTNRLRGTTIKMADVNKLASSTETLNSTDVKDLFEKFKNLSRESKKNINQSYTYLPKPIQHELNLQEKNLLLQKAEEKKFRSLEKYLCKKSKKDASQLLLNSLEGYRIKRELTKPYQPTLSQKNGWNISLRCPKNQKERHIAFVNIKTEKSPFWAILQSDSFKEKEIVLNTETNTHKDKICKYNTNKLENSLVNRFENMKVQGEDLLKLEYNNAMDMKGKVILNKSFEKLEKSFSNTKIIYKNYRTKKIQLMSLKKI